MANDSRMYLDHFEGDQAVLVGEAGQTEQRVPRDALPPNAAEGHWLTRKADGGWGVDQSATEGARGAVQGLMDELSGTQ